MYNKQRLVSFLAGALVCLASAGIASATSFTYTGSTYSVPCSSQPRQPYTHATGGRVGRAMVACKHVRKEVKCGAEVASSGGVLEGDFHLLASEALAGDGKEFDTEGH